MGSLDYKICDSFLPSEQFKEMQNILTDCDFPWRIRNQMAPTDTNIHFTYCFFNNFTIQSNYYETHIIPILKKLNCIAPIQIRSNMYLNKLFNKSDWHVDYHFECKTAILYLNSCNGGTELKINNEIQFVKAEENKILIFPSKTYHRACTSTDVDRRFILNFNYF